MLKLGPTKNLRFYILLTILGYLITIPAPLQANTINEKFTVQTVQGFTEYKGIVVDARTGDPLIFADITLNDSNIRTVTNKEGEFLLKVPNDMLDKYIIVSFLGYKKREIPLMDLRNKSIKIELIASITELNQVQLNVPKSARALVKAALDRKGVSYYNDPTIMTAFYRETIKKRKKNASLSEAVVKIYKEPYASRKNDAVKLVRSRKNTNYSRLDTLALKLQGGPFSALYADIVKYPEYIFTEETLPYYTFKFEPSTEINDRQVYVVKFEQNANVVSPLYYGKMYIDAQTFALTSAVYSLNVEDRVNASLLFVKRKPNRVRVYPLQAAYRVDYKTVDGKWFYGYSNIQLAFNVKWKGKLFSNTYTLSIEMAVTDWEENTTGKLKPANTLKPSVILSNEASGFSDPEFWGEYNIIEPEKSIESAIKKIAKQLKKVKP